MSLSQKAVAALADRARLDVDAGHVPSCQYALAMDGEVLVSETVGEAPADARFAIWSATKPVFASVVWQLMGEGLLDPAAPVVDLWPEFGKNGKDAIRLEHLLTFTAGVPNGEVGLDIAGDRAARARAIEEWELEWEPGTATAYHPLSAHWVMAELVSRVTGVEHCQALRERVFDPLGLDRLELGVPVERQGDIQRMVKTGEPATLEEVAEALGLPSLPPALAEMLEKAAGGDAANPGGDLVLLESPEARAAGVPGGGAVSDAASLALFYQALLHDPKGVWDPKVLHDVTTNVRNTFADPVMGVIANRTLGLELHGDPADPTRRFRSGFTAASPETFGHGGAAGQVAWADPRSGLSFVYLTNGEDRHAVRQARRGRELSAAAVACVEGD